jgi:transcriptional regulator
MMGGKVIGDDPGSRVDGWAGIGTAAGGNYGKLAGQGLRGLDGSGRVVFAGLMHIPKHFTETDPTILRDAVRRIRAGELITYGTDGLEASFVPLLISDDARTVTGHLAKANGQWKRADLSVAALITWVGPYAYVSPNYYPSKAEHGRVVPTWNFTTVQATGDLIFHEEDGWKRDHVESLTSFHEEGSPSPWSVEDAPEDYIDGLITGIVGVEIQVTSLAGKWKLSQNRPQADIAGVIAGLGAHAAGSSEVEVAEEMTEILARHDQ